MQYDKLIDKQTWAFIHKTEAFYAGSATTPSIDEQRAEYDRMCRAFYAGNPDELDIKTCKWDDIPMRIYQPPQIVGTLLYCHGGGYVVGGLESHDDVCAELAIRANLRVISIAYRLAPEHKHPAQFDDVVASMIKISDLYSTPLILAGDSAGGNLAAAACHHARELNIALAGQLLIYPSLGIKMDSGSFIEHANAPLLTRDDMVYYKKVRCENDIPIGDPTFAPLEDTDFTGLPPTVIFTAACDPLADDGKSYQSAIVQAGGKAHWINEAGLIHGYLRARTSADRAKDSFGRIVDAATVLANGQWPY
jgi:acetyl esterase